MGSCVVLETAVFVRVLYGARKRGTDAIVRVLHGPTNLGTDALIRVLYMVPRTSAGSVRS